MKIDSNVQTDIIKLIFKEFNIQPSYIKKVELGNNPLEERLNLQPKITYTLLDEEDTAASLIIDFNEMNYTFSYKDENDEDVNETKEIIIL